MLVLSRRKGERIRIGTDIEIVVTDVVGDRVRLGIVAPIHVPVHREEVYQRVQQEQQSESPRTPLQTNPLQTGPLQTGPLQTNPLQTNPLQTGPLQTGPLSVDRHSLDVQHFGCVAIH